MPADYLDPDKFLVSIQQARYKEIPSNYRKLGSAQIEDINHDLLCSEFTSHQETGIRPACVVPYELYVDGVLSADGTKFELSMTAGNQVHGQNAVGAPFNVYLQNLNDENATNPGMQAATYVVKPRDTLREEFPLTLFANSRYSIDVQAPNGFYRSLAVPLQIICRCVQHMSQWDRPYLAT